MRFNVSGCLRFVRQFTVTSRFTHSQRQGAGATEEALHEARQVCTLLSYPLPYLLTRSIVCSDGSGSIDRNEFLQIPQIANNPLASRMIAIFDEECVVVIPPPFSHSQRSVASCSSCRWGPPVAVVAPLTFRSSLEG